MTVWFIHTQTVQWIIKVKLLMDTVKKYSRRLFSGLVSVCFMLAVSACGSDSKSTPATDPNFTGNALLAGPGGNELEQWQYDGIDRPLISIKRIDGLCTFDNGLVSVIDMNNERDEAWFALSSPRPSNQADDAAFPPHSFQCDESPYSDYRKVMDGEYIWTYSNVNDAMFYGNLVHDTYVKYLGEAPLDDKIRLRVHYGSRSSDWTFWDGAYANFSDAIPFFYSTLSLDTVAHEIAHGVLNRISALDGFDHSISTDARTLHEAFADVSGLMAKYEFFGHTDNWIHGEHLHYFARHLNQIETEYGAIASYLDYDDAGNNYYLRIGMMTYPFYLLTNEWGLETTYNVYLSAARECWTPTTNLPQAASCIQLKAGEKGLSEASVIAAFKRVKIKLFDHGVLGHYTYVANGLDHEFTDNSQSTTQVTRWHWDFGDGTESNEQNPMHSFAQAGSYTVRLTVQDQSADAEYAEDYFERTLTVAEAQ